MSLERLVRQRESEWRRLDDLVGRVGRRGPRRTDPGDLDHLVQLYRATSADLARLRAYQADPALVRRVNRLVTRAHGLVYRAPRVGLGLGTFFARTYPELVRRSWPFVLSSLGLVVLFYLLAHVVVQSHPEVVADVVGGAAEAFGEPPRPGQFGERFQAVPSPVLSSFVTTNNIKVALNAFALGITFGLGTAYVLAVNGTMLGAFGGAYGKSGLGAEFWMTVLPHGALELSAIVVAGASGLRIGYALWCPGRRWRWVALREEALVAVQLAVGLVPAFVVAGLFEGFVTPSSLEPRYKVALGMAAAGAFWTYLLAAGHGQSRCRCLISR